MDKKATNLNSSKISTDDYIGKEIESFNVSDEGKNVEVYFRDIELNLVRMIKEADIVVGCVAWLTSETILMAMSECKGISVIVQKEDFLRPDIGSSDKWKSRLRELYGNLPGTLTRYDDGFQGTSLHMLSCATLPDIEAVRCVGNYNRDRSSAFPRAHHKFVLFCKKSFNMYTLLEASLSHMPYGQDRSISQKTQDYHWKMRL